ncbi:uncharacterized protein K02A2.6-like [Phlebotomus argentipes]|uniref:uncharacterized protein K02A2.6-like n=1 Tax=Phlebotomus argentipes TaxID=94469 RepID=UPI002892D1BF|nr:uncharacterized protein K02A2.6-like [Phlebotomus argentipes]
MSNPNAAAGQVDPLKQITDFLAAQQQTLNYLLNRSHDHEGLIDTLAATCTTFSFDPENGVTFEDWYRRHEDIIKVDGEVLSDSAKVRLLLRKLDSVSFARYSKFILPKNTRDLKFDETVKILSDIFTAPVSIFSKRWKCLQVEMKETEDFIDYMGRVNQLCEDFQFNTLKLDSFKALIFVLGLKNPRFAEVRTRLLHKFDTKVEGIDLAFLLEEAKRFTNLKKDAALVGFSEHTFEPPTATAKVVKKHFKPKPNRKQFNTQNSAPSHSKDSNDKDRPRSPCWFCGNMHYSRDCTYKQHKCTSCNSVGHKDGYCLSASKARKSTRSNVVHIANCATSETRRFIDVSINHHDVSLQYDTASDLTIISHKIWKEIGSPALTNTQIRVKDAQLNVMSILGEFECTIKLNGATHTGRCFVSGSNSNLFGIEWIQLFDLWSKPADSFCRNVSVAPIDKARLIQQLKEEFKNVFDDGLGLCTKTTATLQLKEGAKPIFRAERPVPYHVMDLVECELQRLEDKGIIKPVTSSEWAAPIVVARKANGSVRICGDYSTGLNSALEDNKYPIPTPDDIFQKLASGKIFSNIDLSDAYLQIPVDEDSQKLLTIHTHRSLYHFTRLAPGVSVAPGQFQAIVEGMLAGIDNVAVYFDDICVSGPDITSHIATVRRVLQRLEEYGFHIKLEKCNFFQAQVKYLGHILDSQGLRPDPAKVAAITNMPPPQDVGAHPFWPFEATPTNLRRRPPAFAVTKCSPRRHSALPYQSSHAK